MKTIYPIVGIIILFIGAFWLFKNQANNDKKAGTTTPVISEVNGTTKASAGKSQQQALDTQTGNQQVEKITIRYSEDKGFDPKVIEISPGTTVTFTNESSRDMWPASNLHPTHTLYPNSSIKKCGTSEADRIFDSCGPVPAGESWSFVFEEIGSWSYHDHLKPSAGGSIVVK
jgi:plastocyanin